ncbi:hypothetical protein OG693_39070 (plasmid) [Streptomyces sp. NBC_01259]|uniref:hypothetical protein n=1 Tax=Streptomyces sp. NBC_01259 TaxID=2903800 RepID=UPI002F91911B
MPKSSTTTHHIWPENLLGSSPDDEISQPTEEIAVAAWRDDTTVPGWCLESVNGYWDDVNPAEALELLETELPSSATADELVTELAELRMVPCSHVTVEPVETGRFKVTIRHDTAAEEDQVAL